jgi:hypothetical protein
MTFHAFDEYFQGLFASCIKGLPDSCQWDADRLGFAQIVKARHRHIVRDVNAALLKGLQRPKRHTVICRDDGLETKSAIIQQRPDRSPPAIGGVVTLYDQIFIEAEIVCLKFLLVGLEALFSVDLSLDAAQKGDALVAMLFDQVT